MKIWLYIAILILPVNLCAAEYGDVVINEIMYDAPVSIKEPNGEWIELYNNTTRDINLNGWKWTSDGENWVTIEGTNTTINNRGYIMLVRDIEAFMLYKYDMSGVNYIEINNMSLRNSTDTVGLKDNSDNLIDILTYDSKWGGKNGYSLEKINPTITNRDNISDISNYWITSFISYGTPGRQNSMYNYYPKKPNIGIVELKNRVFAPKNGESVTILYFLETNAQVTIMIYDINGRLIKKIIESESQLAGQEKSVKWDGRDEQMGLMPIGIYICYIEAINDTGITSAKTTVVIGN